MNTQPLEILDMNEDALERIKICKNISNIINQLSNNSDQEWHVYTFKEDKDSINPKRFRVFKTKTRLGKTFPTKHIMDIFFYEPEKIIDVVFKTDIILKNLEKEDFFTDFLYDCLTEAYRDEKWSIVFSKKKNMLEKLLRR